MSRFRSSIGPQLRAHEENAERFIRATLLARGRRIRARLIRERMSKPKGSKGPGVSRKTGKSQRSIQYRIVRAGPTLTLAVKAGGGAAYYVEGLEERGLLGFHDLVQEELKAAHEEIEIGLQFLARSPSAAGVLSAGQQAGSVEELIRETGLEATRERFINSRGFRSRNMGRPKKKRRRGA